MRMSTAKSVSEMNGYVNGLLRIRRMGLMLTKSSLYCVYQPEVSTSLLGEHFISIEWK